MLSPSPLAALILILGLTACTTPPMLELSSVHPANPKAAEGLVDAPTALASYRTAEDFGASAATDGPADRMENMPGMSHGNMQGMAGMQHQGAPSAGKAQ